MVLMVLCVLLVLSVLMVLMVLCVLLVLSVLMVLCVLIVLSKLMLYAFYFSLSSPSAHRTADTDVDEGSVYQWVTESWSFCSINTVDEGSTCGEGVQSRKIRCVLRGDGVNESHTVNDSLCDQDDAPAQARTCILPCPGDCVMSPWSHWSSCPMSCDVNSVRTRTRQMLRPPIAHATCPERNETELCVVNANCFTYQYNVSGWSSCMLSEHAVCGEGARTRLLDCIRSDGKLVDLSVCEELGLPQLWMLSETCRVDCPISCMLSEWTQWTECSHSCGNQGLMSRSRRVLQNAHEEGRPCPSQLSQTKPCPIRPCYSWLLGVWSSCHVE
ncbi:thrombospondin type-1 domain-containing protein 7B isoform X1, partial [Tachysurus ichikawai]